MTSGLSLRVLIVERTALDAHLMARGLDKHGDIRVVATISDSHDIDNIIESVQPDIALVSKELDNHPHRGYEVTRGLHDRCRKVKVILLMDSNDRSDVLEALRAGARGIFSRNGSPELLRRCVARVAVGQIWVNTEHMEFILDVLAGMTSFKVVDANGRKLLTRREQQVLACVANGLTNRDIASEMTISEHTVKNHLFHIFDKLGVSNRVELVMYAISQLTQSQQVVHEAGDDRFPEDVMSAEWYKRAAEEGFSLAEQFHAATFLHKDSEDRVAKLEWLMSAQAAAAEIEKAARNAAEMLESRMTAHQISQAQNRSATWQQRRPRRPDDLSSGNSARHGRRLKPSVAARNTPDSTMESEVAG